MRLFWVFFGLAVVLLVPFLIWGEALEGWWTLERLAEFGRWAWLVGLGLLVGDVLLPMPSTVVMSGLGFLYGVWLGGLLSALGVVLSGLFGYGLCRLCGRGVAVWLAGEEDLARGERLFVQYGVWMVALSRWLPLLSEVMSCLAGLTRMRFGRFLVALVCGALPLGFGFAWLGTVGEGSAVVALCLSALAPPLLWFLLVRGLALWSMLI